MGGGWPLAYSGHSLTEYVRLCLLVGNLRAKLCLCRSIGRIFGGIFKFIYFRLGFDIWIPRFFCA
jgi:hypothetical protein